MNDEKAADLQTRRQNFLIEKKKENEEQQRLQLIRLRKFVNDLMTSEVKEIENHLVENGSIFAEKYIGHLNIVGEYEIEDLKNFWKGKGVTVNICGNHYLVSKYFTLRFTLNETE